MRISDMQPKTREVIDELKLNPTLIVENDVPEENILMMKSKYIELKEIFNKAHSLYDEVEKNGWNDEFIDEAEKIGKELEQLEETLQHLWNFPKDPNYYRYWNLLPGCECPKLDNQERYGFGRIINCDCPYHKHLIEENVEPNTVS